MFASQGHPDIWEMKWSPAVCQFEPGCWHLSSPRVEDSAAALRVVLLGPLIRVTQYSLHARSRRLPTSPPLSPRSPPTPPVAPSEGEDWLWALGHTSQPSAPSRVGRHPEHRAHEERWRSWQGARSAAELAAASLQKPVGSDNSDKRDRAPEELAAEISKQSLEQLEALQQLPACAPPNKLPFCVGVATPRATPRKSSRRRKSSSRPPSAPSFVRPFSLDGDDLRLSGRGMGYGEQRVKPAAALGGLSRGGSRISLEGGSSKPGSVTERQPCNGKREGEGGPLSARAGVAECGEWRRLSEVLES